METTPIPRAIPGGRGGMILQGGKPGNAGGAGTPSHAMVRAALSEARISGPNGTGLNVLGSISRMEPVAGQPVPTYGQATAAMHALSKFVPQVVIQYDASVDAQAILSALPQVLARFLSNPEDCAAFIRELGEASKAQVEPEL
jgi:hypothetical protein